MDVYKPRTFYLQTSCTRTGEVIIWFDLGTLVMHRVPCTAHCRLTCGFVLRHIFTPQKTQLDCNPCTFLPRNMYTVSLEQTSLACCHIWNHPFSSEFRFQVLRKSLIFSITKNSKIHMQSELMQQWMEFGICLPIPVEINNFSDSLKSLQMKPNFLLEFPDD